MQANFEQQRPSHIMRASYRDGGLGDVRDKA
jgi:hypothetical protein